MESFKSHILVIDDDEGIRSLLKQFLNENGYLVMVLSPRITPDDSQISSWIEGS